MGYQCSPDNSTPCDHLYLGDIKDIGNYRGTVDHKEKIQDIKYNGCYKQEILS